jgi:hypothetical protein
VFAYQLFIASRDTDQRKALFNSDLVPRGKKQAELIPQEVKMGRKEDWGFAMLCRPVALTRADAKPQIVRCWLSQTRVSPFPTTKLAGNWKLRRRLALNVDG